MILYIKNIFTILFLLIPFFLITGPAIPDIIISSGVIFGLFWLLVKEKRYDLFNDNFIKSGVLLWFGLLIISFFAIYKDKSFQDSLIFIRYLLIPICLYYLYFKNQKILNYFFIIVFILVIFVSLDTFYQFLNYTSEYGFGTDLLGFKSNWYGRLTGPFGDELIPGSYLSKFGLIGYMFILTNINVNKKTLVHTLYLSSILVICFLSGERMSFASFLLGLFVLLFFLKGNRIKILISILFGFLIIFSFYKFHPFYNDYKIIESKEYHQGLKIEKNFNCGENKICTKIIDIQPSFIEVLKNFSTSAYGEIYLLSYKMFIDHPITGVGINNFKKLCENEKIYKRMMVNYDCASHPHNTYLQWLAEGGIITFSLFILYLILLSNFIIKNDGNKNNKVIALVLILILFWPIMSTGSLIKNWYGISVFFIIGISICISKFKVNY